MHVFITYFLFLLASSLAITAFFCVTRGETEVMPDGSIRRYGKILKGYFFFWFKEKGSRRMYYTGDQLAGLTVQLRQHYDGVITLPGNPDDPATITAFETTENFRDVMPVLRSILKVQFSTEALGDGRVAVRAYEEEPEYVFPLWLRTVMAGCITCTPTIYGNITFWTSVYVFRDDVFYDILFGGFKDPRIGVLVVWLAYWISLAWLNTVLWNIYNRSN